jgi:hypothetical protein
LNCIRLLYNIQLSRRVKNIIENKWLSQTFQFALLNLVFSR